MIFINNKQRFSKSLFNRDFMRQWKLSRSRKQPPGSENVPAGSVLATVQSNSLHFIDEETEALEEKKTDSGSTWELESKLKPKPGSALSPQPISMSTSSTHAGNINPKHCSHISGLKTEKISPGCGENYDEASGWASLCIGFFALILPLTLWSLWNRDSKQLYEITPNVSAILKMKNWW